MPTATELRERGMAWKEIADELGFDGKPHEKAQAAMQQWRDENYEHWDTGWEMEADRTHASIETGPFLAYPDDGDAAILIEELSGDIPLNIHYEDDEDDLVMGIMAPLTPDQARRLARTLNECADIVEGKKP